MRIKEGDECKTAFNCRLGSFQFKVMPFGLQGAPAVFMQLINEMLHEHLYKGILVYLNNILIFSETLEEHTKLVHQVLKKLLGVKPGVGNLWLRSCMGLFGPSAVAPCHSVMAQG